MRVSRNQAVLIGLIGLISIGAVWWLWPSDERDIRRRLDQLARVFNETATEGLGAVAHAARLGSFFTDDVVVEFGQGTPPIRGRETLMGMAVRLQPRTAAFSLELKDVQPDVTDGFADVNLTAAITRRNTATGEETLDAREFVLGMTKADGDWRISRVAAVDTLK